MKKEDGVYIVDSLKNASAYADYGVNFAKAIAFLGRPDLMRLPVGRYELDGDKAFAMVQDTTLKAWGTGRPELHREYFDIQLPITGEETIGIGRFDPVCVGDFNVEKDIGFYDDATVEPVTLQPGEFAILHPDTCAHAPCCSEDSPGAVIRKIVIKIRK